MPLLGGVTGLVGSGLGGLTGVVGSGTVFRAYAETSFGGVDKRFMLVLDPSGVTGGAQVVNYLDVQDATATTSTKPDLTIRVIPNSTATQVRIEVAPHQGRALTGLTLCVYIALDGDVAGTPAVPTSFAFVEFRGGPVDGAAARELPPSLTAVLERPAPTTDETIGLSFSTAGCIEPLWIEAGSFKGPLLGGSPTARTTAYVATNDTYTEPASLPIRAGNRQNPTEAVRAELRVRNRTAANLALSPLGVKVTAPYVISRPPRDSSVALAGQGAGAVDRGTHSYRVTFVLRNGNETSASLETAPVDVTDPAANGRVRLTAIPTGPSQGSQPLDVVRRRIYRSRAGDRGEHFLVAELPNNTATTFVDNVADSGLGDPLPGRVRVEYTASVPLDMRAVLRARDGETGADDRVELNAERLPTTVTIVQDNRAIPRLSYTAGAPVGFVDVTLPTLDGPETTYARATVRELPTPLTGHWRSDSDTKNQIELAGSALGLDADPIEELSLVLSRGERTLLTSPTAVEVELTDALDAAGTSSRTSLCAAARRLRRLRIALGEQGDGPADADPSLMLSLGAQTPRALHVRANTDHPDAVRDYTDLTLSALPDRVELTAIVPRVVGRPRRTTAASLAAQGAGSVDRGTHSYRVTFVLRNGNETGASLETASVDVVDPAANGRVRLTAIPTGPSQGNRPLDVIRRRIYRSRAGDRGEHFLVAELQNNSATEFVDNLADSALGDPLPGRAKVIYTGSASLDADAILRSLDRETGSEKRIEARVEDLPNDQLTVDYDNRRVPRLTYKAESELTLGDVTLPTLGGPETTYARALVRRLPKTITAHWRFDSERKSLIELAGAALGTPADPIGSLALVLANGLTDLPPGRQAVAVEIVDQRQPSGEIMKLFTRVAVTALRRLRLATGEAGVHALDGDGLKLLLAHGATPSLTTAAASRVREPSLRFLRHVDRHGPAGREHSRLWVRAGSLPPVAQLDLRATGDEYLGLRIDGAAKRLKVLSLSSPKSTWQSDEGRIWLTVPETGERIDFVSDPSGQRLVSDMPLGAELSLRDPSAPSRSANAFRHLKALLWLPGTVALLPARVVYGSADAGSTSTSLVDADGEFDPAWRRMQLRWRTGALAGQRREIVAIADATTLTTTPFGAAPAPGDIYAIEGRPVEGTADVGSTATELVDAAGGFDTNWRDMTLTYTSGSQRGQTRKIKTVADTSRLTTDPFTGGPSAGDRYRIEGPSGISLETGAGAAAGRLALGRQADSLLAVRATPQVRLRNGALPVPPASSALDGATARVLGVRAFNLTSRGELTEAHAELDSNRANRSLRVALQEQALDGATRDALKARISEVPPDAALLMGAGEGVFELRLSEPSGEGSLWAEPAQKGPPTPFSVWDVLVESVVPLKRVTADRGIGLLQFNLDAIPRRVRLSALKNGSGPAFDSLGWNLPGGWELPAILLEASGIATLSFVRMISYSRDREPPGQAPSTFLWSRTDARLISWEQQSPVAAPGRPRLDPIFLWTPGEITPKDVDDKKAGIGFQISPNLRLTLDLDSYSARTQDSVRRWDSFSGSWQLEAELQMQGYSGTCLIVPPEVGGPVAGTRPPVDEQAGPGLWFLRKVNGRPFYAGFGSVFFGNTRPPQTGDPVLSKPRIFQ